MSKGPFFITGTYRSGSTFLSRIINAHPCVSLSYDSVNYFRWYIKKQVDPANFERIVFEIKNRLQKRYQINLDYITIIEELNKRNIVTHKDIYSCVMRYLNHEKEIWGEKTLLEWTNIPLFLSYFPLGKVVHIIRDPRAVTASYKHMTIEPNNRYLDAAFCCLSSLQFAQRYSRILNTKSYLIVKYEDLVSNEVHETKKICRLSRY